MVRMVRLRLTTASFIAARMRVFGGGITYNFGPATGGFRV